MLLEEWGNFLNHLITTSPDQCDTSEKWHQRRGEIAALRFVLAAKEQAQMSLKNLPDREFPDEPAKEPERNQLED